MSEPHPLRLEASLAGVFAGPRATPAAPPSRPLGAELPPEAFRDGPSSSDGASPLPRRVSVDPDLPERGAIVDKYRLEELLGVGGFAAVYRATHLLLRAPVALKLLLPKVVRNRPRMAELLCEEARFAAQINHPNVVRVYDVTHNERVTYVVMEYIEGLSLAETITRGGPLAPARVVQVGLDICAGLHAGLDEGLVHRDVKPSNIILSTTGVAKLVDLGLAQPDIGSALRTEASGPAFVGTPGYMAPEQALQADRVDFRADVYGLGATLYHAATGQPPFPLEDRRRVIAQHRSDPVPDPRSVRPGLPDGLARLLLWMLEKDPARRPASYALLSTELRAVGAALGER